MTPVARSALVALGAVAAVLLGALPAHAAGDSLLEVSNDGTHFAPNPTATLFDDIGRVVPGDAATESTWVRSTASEPGRLRVDLVDVSTDDPALASATTVALAVDGVNVGSVRIADSSGSCLLVADDTVLAPGQTARLDATVAIDPVLGERAGESGRSGTSGTVGFRMRATLSDAKVPAAAADVCDLVAEPIPTPGATAPLSITGQGAPLAAAAVGVVVLAAGAWAAAARIRRRETETP